MTREELDKIIWGNVSLIRTQSPTESADPVEGQPIHSKTPLSRREDYCQIVTWIMDGHKVIAVREPHRIDWFETAINFDPSQEEDYVYQQDLICGEYYRTLRPATFDDIVEWLENPNIKHFYDLNTLCYSKEDKCFYIHTYMNYDEHCNYINDWRSEPLGEPIISINLLDSHKSRKDVCYEKYPR